jgi:hypothetical protein
VLRKQFTNIFLGGFVDTILYHILLHVIVLSGIIHAPWVQVAHIGKAVMTVLVGTIEVAITIIVAKPTIISLTVTYAKVNPCLSNNAIPHDSQCHTTLFVDFLKAR